jgi:hypothetical protein
MEEMWINMKLLLYGKNTSIPMWQVGIQGGKAYILTIQISFSAFQLLKVPQQCN